MVVEAGSKTRAPGARGAGMQRHARLFLLFTALGCRASPPPPAAPESAAKPGPAASTVGLEAVDPSVDPCDDFYRHACGPWLAAHPRPPEAPVWSRSFSVAEQRTAERLRALLDASEGTEFGAYWRACNDAARRTEVGLEALAPLFAAIDAIEREGLAPALGALHARGVHALWTIRRSPGASAPRLTFGVVGLGAAAAYDRGQGGSRLAAYRRHVAEMLRLAGVTDAERRADAVVDFEAALAASQPTEAELIAEQTRPLAPRSLAELRRALPVLDWDRYFAALGQAPAGQLVVSPWERAPKLVALLRRTDPAVLRDYLRWHALHWTATALPPAFVAEHAAMVGESRPLACVREVEVAFGPALGRAYVERHVSADDRERVRALTERLRGALRAEVEGAGWIDRPTRDALIAYVDGLALEVATSPSAPPSAAPREFLAAHLELRRARVAAQLAGTATLARFPATAINAAMLGQAVEVPAGLLQPPFYAPEMSEAVQLGAIGQVIAHEFGHAVDPGTLTEALAWTPAPATATAYAARLQCVQDSLSRTEIEPGLRVDGRMMTTEAFADVVGLRAAHALARAGGPAAERDFFVAWAQLQCAHYTPEALRMQAQTDAPPAPTRINAPLAGLPAFAAAFGCAEGSPMRPRERCEAW